MASVEQVLKALDAVLDKLDEAIPAVAGARKSMEEAAGVFGEVLTGCEDPDAGRVPGMVSALPQEINDLHEQLQETRNTINGYATSLRGQATGPVAAPTRPNTLEARIEQIRRQMRPSPDGAQTTGWKLLPDGSRQRVLSGPDDDPNGMVRQAENLVQKNLPPSLRGASSLARHVEVKVAMSLREPGATQDAVVVVDKTVCGRSPQTADRPFTCDTYLPFFLPKGANLTVVEHDGRRITYRGKGPQ